MPVINKSDYLDAEFERLHPDLNVTRIHGGLTEMIEITTNKEPPFFASVNGKVMHLPGDSRQECEDFVKLSFWLCGKREPKIVWPPEAKNEQKDH